MNAVPPNALKFRATCTALDDTQAVLDIQAPNHLGALTRVLCFLCDNPVVTKKIVLELTDDQIIPAVILPKSR